MKIVNNTLIFIVLICMISCKQNHNYTSNAEVNSDADSLRYRLRILDAYSDSVYKTDDKYKSEILVEKKIYVLDSCFGSPENMQKLMEYVKEQRSLLKNISDVSLRTSIEIKNNKNVYEKVWLRSEPIFIFDDQVDGEKIITYSSSESRIDLSECYVQYNNRTADGIKISFHYTTSDKGYKIYMLNFVRHKNIWVLVSRERLNTIKNEVNGEPLGYCYDTINTNCNTIFKGGEVVYINNEMLYDLTNEACY